MQLFGKIYTGKIIRITEGQQRAFNELISEGNYDDSSTPLLSKTITHRDIGKNPLTVDNGGHAASGVLLQPSTYDYNGANFKGINIVVSDNKFMFYKVKNFGTDKIGSTLQLFGRGAGGEKGLRAAIDTLNGAAKRNNRNLMYRTITSESFKQRSEATDHMSNTFWEFSYDNGMTWYILKPNPVQNMKKSEVFIRM